MLVRISRAAASAPKIALEPGTRRAQISSGHLAPAAPREIEINDRTAGQSHREKPYAYSGFAEQQLPRTEQEAVNQDAAADPVHKIVGARAIGLYLRRHARHRLPTNNPRPRTFVETH